MATPSLASIISTSNAPTTITSSTKGKSELNEVPDELKQPLSSEALKRDKATVQRCHKPLQKNPFTTYRDPVTGQWMVERNKR